MREIKFRVFDKDYKVMHIVGKDSHDSLTCWDGIVQYHNLQNGEGSGEHGSYELMQYTRLKDSHGKEIFEGDIVEHMYRVYEGYGNVGEQVETIFIKDITKLPFSDASIGCKVIGNIFENPELLEGELK